MGFRGEALAAIAVGGRAVDHAAAAPMRRTHPGSMARSGELAPAARATGTTVEVRELFFSTPARRKFLKTDATELAHCIEAVRRHALARPDVGFAVWHDGKLVEQWRAAANAAERAAPTCSAPSSSPHSRDVDEARGPLRIRGRAGIPDAARARADQQYLYVNGRFVRDRVLAHGVRAAPTKTCCTARASRCMRCSSRSTRRASTSTCTRPRSRCAFAMDARCTRRCAMRSRTRWRRRARRRAAGAEMPVEAAALAVATGARPRLASSVLHGGRADAAMGRAAVERAAASLRHEPRSRAPQRPKATAARPRARPARRRLHPGRERAGSGHRRHARGARAHRLRAAEGEPRCGAGDRRRSRC